MPHRLDTGIDRYTALAASAEGRRLVATLARPRGTLWRLAIGDGRLGRDSRLADHGSRVLPSSRPGYLIWVSSKGTSEGIWRLAGVLVDLAPGD